MSFTIEEFWEAHEENRIRRQEEAETKRLERRRINNRNYRINNKDRVKQLRAACDAANPGKRREYIKNSRTNYYLKNKEKIRAINIKWRENNKARVRDARLKLAYGISQEEFDTLLAKQGGRCACCRADTPRCKRGWMIDHCHKTNKIRGILCLYCNSALGMVKDNIKTLHKMVAYLEVNNVPVN